eukprot:TRINITY_DN9936_c0_g1_i1.p1 TRINITY_DN9936_c0_g1~~TRINITY_DN9936_c0_g1_i1.p1  ORF type:complete len:632 (+),score=95.11 TRINITY_DN9936_c0_g1_i1:78-1973(+)
MEFIVTLRACCGCSRRRSSPSSTYTQTEAQTESQVMVEFEADRQCALRVVFLIDSSSSVEKQLFGETKQFVETLVDEIDMPAVQVGLIRFNHKYSETSPITGNRDDLLYRLRNMEYEAGETKIVSAMEHAATMLDEASTSERCRQAVVLITDGEWYDIQAAVDKATYLKQQCLIEVFCVHIGGWTEPRGLTDQQQQIQNAIDKVVSKPEREHAVALSSYDADGWLKMRDALLTHLLWVSRKVRRVKCNLNLLDFRETDLSTVAGHDMLVPDWEPQVKSIFWERQHSMLKLSSANPCPPQAMEQVGPSAIAELSMKLADSTALLTQREDEIQRLKQDVRTLQDKLKTQSELLKECRNRSDSPTHDETLSQETGHLRNCLHQVTYQKLKEEQSHGATKQRLEESRAREAELNLQMDALQSVTDKIMVALSNAMHSDTNPSQRCFDPEWQEMSGAPDPLENLRRYLEEKQGHRASVPYTLDGTHPGEITVTDMIQVLARLGLSTEESQLLLRRLRQLNGTQGQGSLKLLNSRAGFGYPSAASSASHPFEAPSGSGTGYPHTASSSSHPFAAPCTSGRTPWPGKECSPEPPLVLSPPPRTGSKLTPPPRTGSTLTTPPRTGSTLTPPSLGSSGHS